MPSADRTVAAITADLQETARLHTQLSGAVLEQVAKAALLMTEALRTGRKIIWFGNGGSATQSQHMAGEFVGRFRKERRSLASISLTENMASVTAIGNDYAYDQIFSRQLEGLAQAGDVAVGLSTSGNSPNVVLALEKSKTLSVKTIGMTGGSGGKMAALCDVSICVPSTITARIQEVHLTIGHILCGLVEDALLSSPSR
ncbi:MAG: phosphoheptose isomerase [Candidatus Omnitrophica bacterium CG11_big_fil_rev_8_21_14_0_20_63_9]|nr:MAG: phosphoheptose isomerase [Candidatus Omnitrophica bacterium CG11_big_fil_rev_8_21_14_0_20_63_9]